MLRLIFVAAFAIVCARVSGKIPSPPPERPVFVRKCCAAAELYNHTGSEQICGRAADYDNDTVLWTPEFTEVSSMSNFRLNYKLLYGKPDCKSRIPWPIYNWTCDRLSLLPTGQLRHYVSQLHLGGMCTDEVIDKEYYDYTIEEYCIDKEIANATERLVAWICAPRVSSLWQNSDFFIRRIVNPVFHVISIICLLVVAVIYFVLPQLSDLVGNIVTTIAICLIINQVADIVRIFTEYNSDVTFLTADSVMYISSLGAFFWLNSFGYYLWITFRSRNVFLRITDGKKYCYYSFYVWGSTFCMAFMALFAHVVLDSNVNLYEDPKPVPAETTIGWLGTAVFFTPIAFTIFANLFFCLSTVQVMKRMSSYGRIHHKLKYSFQLFVKIFGIMTVTWIFFILSWLPFIPLFHIYVFVSMLQSLAILYVAVINVKKIRFLLRKACCYEQCIFPCCRPGDPNEATEWGEEMMAMNLNSY